MKNIQGSQTEKNLLKVFASETIAAFKYDWFAKVAKKEGYEEISAVFLKTSLQEKSHAKRFYRCLNGVNVTLNASFPSRQTGTTMDNLNTAIAEEHEEWNIEYPGYAETAKSEGFPEIAAIFRLIANAEKTHERRFQNLYSRLLDNSFYNNHNDIEWECTKCGYIHTGKEPPEICPACLHPKGYFEKAIF